MAHFLSRVWLCLIQKLTCIPGKRRDEICSPRQDLHMNATKNVTQERRPLLCFGISSTDRVKKKNKRGKGEGKRMNKVVQHHALGSAATVLSLSHQLAEET